MLCSTGAADRAGVPADRRVCPLAAVESNHMLPISRRAGLHRAAVTRLGRAHHRPSPASTSRRPTSSTSTAASLRGPHPGPRSSAFRSTTLDRCSVGGGMTFGGGPLNNATFPALAAWCQMLARRRAPRVCSPSSAASSPSTAPRVVPPRRPRGLRLRRHRRRRRRGRASRSTWSATAASPAWIDYFTVAQPEKVVDLAPRPRLQSHRRQLAASSRALLTTPRSSPRLSGREVVWAARSSSTATIAARTREQSQARLARRSTGEGYGAVLARRSCSSARPRSSCSRSSPAGCSRRTSASASRPTPRSSAPCSPGSRSGAWGGGKLADRIDPRRLLGPDRRARRRCSRCSPSRSCARSATSRARAGAAPTLFLAFTAFFLPAVVLSAVTPMVVKLQLHDLHRTGGVVGRLSGISTARRARRHVRDRLPARGDDADPHGHLRHRRHARWCIGVGLGLGLVASRHARSSSLIAVLGAARRRRMARERRAPCQVESAYYCIRVEHDLVAAERPHPLARRPQCTATSTSTTRRSSSSTTRKSFSDAIAVAWPARPGRSTRCTSGAAASRCRATSRPSTRARRAPCSRSTRRC